MSQWFPKNNQVCGALTATASGASYIKSKPELPEVGDTIYVAALPYGHQIVGEGSQIPNGTDVIEVEVKALKKAKVTVE